MKQVACATLISIAIGIFNASAAEQTHLERGVDVLYAQIGTQRIGVVNLLEKTPYAGLNYLVRVPLLVDGKQRFYTMHLDANFQVADFRPDGWPFVPSGLVEYPPGYDTYRQPKQRQAAIAAVEHLNLIRKEKTYGRPAVQKVGSDLLVTYQWTSQTRTKRGDLVQAACLSFAITPGGTIYAQMWGFWPTKSKLPLLPLRFSQQPSKS